MTLKINCSGWGRFFNVPCSVVDKYIKLADGDFIKVLLCILSGETNCIDTEKLSVQTGLSEQRVKDAVLFWLSEEVITTGAAEAPAPNEKREAVAVSAEIVHEKKKQKKTEVPKPEGKAPVRISLSPSDLAQKLSDDPQLKGLVTEYEKIKGCDIKHHEIIGLINLTEYYGYDASALLLIISYCNTLGKNSIGYIESIAKDWSQKGITDYSEVEAEIIRQSRIKSFEYKVSKLMGLESKPSTNQLKYIHKWQDMGMSLELLQIAYDKTLDAINKADFRYMDKIIANWSENGLTTKEQIEEFDSGHTKKTSNNPKENKNTSYDIDKWEQFAMNFDPNFRRDNNE